MVGVIVANFNRLPHPVCDMLRAEMDVAGRDAHRRAIQAAMAPPGRRTRRRTRRCTRRRASSTGAAAGAAARPAASPGSPAAAAVCSAARSVPGPPARPACSPARRCRQPGPARWHSGLGGCPSLPVPPPTCRGLQRLYLEAVITARLVVVFTKHPQSPRYPSAFQPVPCPTCTTHAPPAPLFSSPHPPALVSMRFVFTVVGECVNSACTVCRSLRCYSTFLLSDTTPH